MWGRGALITHHLCEMKGPESSQPPCWTQLSCYKECLTGVAGTWPSPSLASSLLLSLFFSHSLALCHCFTTGWPLSPPSLLGVVRELTVPVRSSTPAFAICFFPLFSINITEEGLWWSWSRWCAVLHAVPHYCRGQGPRFQDDLWVTWCQRSGRGEMELLSRYLKAKAGESWNCINICFVTDVELHEDYDITTTSTDWIKGDLQWQTR